MPTPRKHSTPSRLAALEARTCILETHLEATLRILANHLKSDHNVTHPQEETK